MDSSLSGSGEESSYKGTCDWNGRALWICDTYARRSMGDRLCKPKGSKSFLMIMCFCFTPLVLLSFQNFTVLTYSFPRPMTWKLGSREETWLFSTTQGIHKSMDRRPHVLHLPSVPSATKPPESSTLADWLHMPEGQEMVTCHPALIHAAPRPSCRLHLWWQMWSQLRLFYIPLPCHHLPTLPTIPSSLLRVKIAFYI